MGLLFPCILLLVISGAVFATDVVNGILGRYVYFNESITDEKLLLQWIFGGSAVANRVPGFLPGYFSSCIGRCQLYDNGTLRLDNLTSADEGRYTFTAQLPPSTIVKEASYDLRVYHVLDAPVISSNDTSRNLIGGSYVSLHCNASGQTVTTYTFYRDEKNICSNPNVTCKDSDLYFHPIAGSDSGSYTCTIQNPVSSNSSRNSVQLNVIDPVSDVKLTRNNTGLVWPGLDSVSLNCSARGTNITYSWHLEGELLLQTPQYQFNENRTVLTIHPITANDNGTFTCTASNQINNQTSNGIIFNLASGISVVTLTGNTTGSYIWVGEDSVSLNCSADGSDVTFFWNLNEERLPQGPQYHLSEGDSKLLISPVSKIDDGPFTCEASNRLGSKNSSDLNLNLAWKPEGNISCSATSNAQDITLGCSWSGGHPEANVSLSFNGKTDNAMNNVTSLVSIVDGQGKVLTCLGDQLGRKSQCTLPIGPPVAIGHDNNAITKIEVGRILNLTVTLEPGLPANFIWSHTSSGQSKASIQGREAQVISTDFSSSYVIRDVKLQDAGKYECIANNTIGTKKFLFTVNVDKNGLSGGAIAGIVIGVLAGVALIGIAVFFIVKKK